MPTRSIRFTACAIACFLLTSGMCVRICSTIWAPIR